ncbi:hypothetical protein [Bacillus cereus]|uniref:hypothetical protein n=1 Tax=Bacillus cereus TaxID=1396 RepID=UPI000BF84729|nr:hypothetical protein [Bacillus cereus]PFV57424.1 hypothetical protein COL00_05175 [Bacillus cereus]PGQ10794.1 hypothetical protein COA09_19205 [Bacillus cereus]PGS61446.1 hypothetical protein COC67_10145 [Bacillus cereus]PGV07366.1 hypothetical protein COD77_15950 [Bacillus cereus]
MIFLQNIHLVILTIVVSLFLSFILRAVTAGATLKIAFRVLCDVIVAFLLMPGYQVKRIRKKQNDYIRIIEKQRGIKLTEKELQMIKRTLESKRIYLKVMHFNIVHFREVINTFVEKGIEHYEKKEKIKLRQPAIPQRSSLKTSIDSMTLNIENELVESYI